MLRRLLRSEDRTIFCLCLILIAGPGMSVLFDFDLSGAVDQKSYWSMAHLDFNTSPHRKYRFITPLLAAGVNAVIQGVAQLVRPGTLGGDFSMKFSFYLVNTTIAALWCTLIWKYCRAYGMSALGAAAGLLVVTTSRWTAMYAGTPHTDLLYCLAIICTLYGIKTKDSRYLFTAIFLGPFSKELFLFIAPVLFFSHWPKWKTALWVFISGIPVFAGRFIIDTVTHQPVASSIIADLHIFDYLPSQIARLRIMGYWIELFATLGLWWLLPVAEKILLKRVPDTRAFLREPYVIAFLLSVLWQMVFDGEYARMSYMLMPAYAVITGFAIQRLYRYRAALRA